MFQRIKSSLSASQSKTKPCSAFKKICSKLLPLEKKEVLVGWCLESDMRGRDSVRSFEWKFKYNPCLGSLHTRQSFAKFRRSEGRRQSLTELCSTNPALSSSSHISTNWLGKTPLNDLSFRTNSDQVKMCWPRKKSTFFWRRRQRILTHGVIASYLVLGISHR